MDHRLFLLARKLQRILIYQWSILHIYNMHIDKRSGLENNCTANDKAICLFLSVNRLH